MTLEGKKIVITGASRGIGRYLALDYGPKCGQVVLGARSVDELEDAAAEVRERGGACKTAPLDLSSSASIRGFVEAVHEDPAPVDILIHNAADVTSKPLAETSLEEIDSLVRTNVTGPLQLTRLLISDLSTNRGAVVHMTSLAGYKANPAQTVYSITKSAIISMSDALRAELKEHHIHVMTVALPSVDTGDKPMPKGVPVATVANRIESGLEHERRELFFSPITKFLMRTYAAFPVLKQGRQ